MSKPFLLLFHFLYPRKTSRWVVFLILYPISPDILIFPPRLDGENIIILYGVKLFSGRCLSFEFYLCNFASFQSPIITLVKFKYWNFRCIHCTCFPLLDVWYSESFIIINGMNCYFQIVKLMHLMSKVWLEQDQVFWMNLVHKFAKRCKVMS